MELTGTIIAIMPAKSGVSARTGNPWITQEYVIEVPGQYPKKCAFSIFGEDRIKQFNLQPGEQNVTVQFDIDAREYNGRYYNDIRCYNVLRACQQDTQPAAAAGPRQADMFAGQGAQQQAPAQNQNPFPPATQDGQDGGNTDDLPF